MMTTAEIVRELHSAVCPVCHREKVKRVALCGTCLNVLPPHMRDGLRKSFGMGFEQAYEQAKRCAQERRLTASQVGAGRHAKR